MSRGLRAVARVRGVREQQSQLHLQRALAQQRDRAADLAALQAQLASADVAITARMHLVNLAPVIAEAHEAVTAAGRTTDLAREQWEHDKSRLTAVERLLERRDLEHRAEIDRALARDADELASSGWLRAHRPDTAEGHS